MKVSFVQIIFNITVISCLTGIVTTSLDAKLVELKEGRTRVLEEDHTLILGWNEATARVIVQTGFLRRQYAKQNENKVPLLATFPLLKVLYRPLGLLEAPSSTMVANDIVLLSNKTIEDIQEVLELELARRGIEKKYTKFGQNIIVRKGDPMSTSDLLRVGVHTAASIIIMVTDDDANEKFASNGKIQNGATLRTLLNVRHTILTHLNYNPETKKYEHNPALRIVAQLSSLSPSVSALGLNTPDVNGNIIPRVLPLDLTLFLNSLMFQCIAQPGMAKVLLELFDFEGKSIRRRKAKNIRGGPSNMQKYLTKHNKTFGDLRREYPGTVFIGMVRLSEAKIGLCCEDSIQIKNEDLIIFVGKTSMPKWELDGLRRYKEFEEEGSTIMRKGLRKTLHLDLAKSRKSVLICGWRDYWSFEKKRLRQRLESAMLTMAEHSMIIFMNFLTKEEFQEVMVDECNCTLASAKETIDYYRKYGVPVGLYADEVDSDDEYALTETFYKWPSDGIFIRHVIGDAATFKTLKKVVHAEELDTVIILGSQKERPGVKELSMRSKDTRILNIMLLLRRLWNERFDKSYNKDEVKQFHVIGENHEDTTARIALVPNKLEKLDASGTTYQEPDFINTQAIYARVITMTAAYPLLYPSLSELFSGRMDARVKLLIIRSSAYLPRGKLKHGVIRYLIEKRNPDDCAIYLGYFQRDNQSLELLPDPDATISIDSDNIALIIMRGKRQMSDEEIAMRRGSELDIGYNNFDEEDVPSHESPLRNSSRLQI